VTGFVRLGLGFPPPVGFGFPIPLGFGFDQIGFSVEGGADICSSSKVPTNGGSVRKVVDTETTGEFDGSGAVKVDGEGCGSGQSLLQIATSLQ